MYVQPSWIPLQNPQLWGFLPSVLFNLCLVACRDAAQSLRSQLSTYVICIDTNVDLQVSAPQKAPLMEVFSSCD